MDRMNEVWNVSVNNPITPDCSKWNPYVE